jgi:integrase
MTLEALEALTEAMPGRYQALVTLAAGTGLRQGEILGLTTDRIDFLRRQLTVDRQLITMPDRAPYLAPPKTQASVRVVPLPQVVVDALAVHLATWPADEFLFTTELGDPIRRTAFSERIWRPALKRARPQRRHNALPPPLLREPAHPARGVGQDRPGAARARQRRRDSRHLQPPVARLGRPDTGRGGRRPRTSCGLRAD